MLFVQESAPDSPSPTEPQPSRWADEAADFNQRFGRTPAEWRLAAPIRGAFAREWGWAREALNRSRVEGGLEGGLEGGGEGGAEGGAEGGLLRRTLGGMRELLEAVEPDAVHPHAMRTHPCAVCHPSPALDLT